METINAQRVKNPNNTHHGQGRENSRKTKHDHGHSHSHDCSFNKKTDLEKNVAKMHKTIQKDPDVAFRRQHSLRIKE
jgi:hypothetical protein